MPRDGVLTLFGINDAKLLPMLENTGAAATYDSPIDIPGIRKIELKPDVMTKDLYGDEETLDYFSKVKKWEGSIEHAQISLQVLAKLFGNTWATSGSSPNEAGTFTWKSTDRSLPFQIQGLCTYIGGTDVGGGGSGNFYLYCCYATGYQVAAQTEDYATVSFDVVVIGRRLDNKGLEIVENETSVALSTSADSSAPTVSSTTPADAATGVAATGTVTVNFGEAMLLSSISDAAHYTLTRANGDGVTLGAITVVTDQQVTVAYASLTSGQVYIFTITTGVRDPSGNRMAAPYSINFTIA